MKRKVTAALMQPGAVIGRVLRRFRTVKRAENLVGTKEKTGSAGPADAPEKRVAERRKGYVHGGEKKMRKAKNRRRRAQLRD